MHAGTGAKRCVILQRQRSDPLTEQCAVNITAQPNTVQEVQNLYAGTFFCFYVSCEDTVLPFIYSILVFFSNARVM